MNQTPAAPCTHDSNQSLWTPIPGESGRCQCTGCGVRGRRLMRATATVPAGTIAPWADGRFRPAPAGARSTPASRSDRPYTYGSTLSRAYPGRIQKLGEEFIDPGTLTP